MRTALLAALGILLAVLSYAVPARASTGAVVTAAGAHFVPGDAAAPAVLSVKRGDDLVFANPDALFGTHTLTSYAQNSSHKALFDTGDVNFGAQKSITITVAAGTYRFHCLYHSGMEGVLVVS